LPRVDHWPGSFVVKKGMQVRVRAEGAVLTCQTTIRALFDAVVTGVGDDGESGVARFLPAIR
jgi:hypothetical protein